jgi:hypothetical protein
MHLYGFASMLLATSQAQARKIETLEREVARLRAADRHRTTRALTSPATRRARAND